MTRPTSQAGRRASAAALLLTLLTAAYPALGQSAASRPASRPAPDERAQTPLREIRGRELPASAAAQSQPLTPEAAELLRACESLLEEGQAGRAIGRLRSFLEQAQEPPYELEVALARAYLETGQVREAREVAERASAARPERGDAHYLLGVIEEATGQDDAALRAFRSATLCADRDADRPMVTAAWYRLARLLESRGLLLAAVEAYERFDAAAFETYTEHQVAAEVAEAVEAHPHGTAGLRAALLRRAGRPEQALAVLRKALDAEAPDARIRSLYVETLVDAGRGLEAYEVCEQRGAEGDLPPAIVLDAARAAGRLEDWLRAVRDGLEGDESIARAVRVTRLLRAAGEFAAERALWEAIVARRPSSPRFRWLHAAALKAQGEWNAALDVLSETLRSPEGATDPGGEAWQEWLSPVRGDEGLVRALERARVRHSRDVALDLACALLAASAGKPDTAEALMAACLQARANYVPALTARALLQAAAFDWNAARESAQRAIDADREYAAAHHALGRALDGLDEHDGALAAYRAAVQLRPFDAVYAIGLARRLRGSGESLAAERHLSESLDQGAVSDDAVEELVETYLASGKVEVAKSRLDRERAAGLGRDSERRLETLLRFVGGETQAYADELERQAAAHPKDVKTARRLALVKLELRDAEAAERILDSMRGAGADDEETWQLSARAAAGNLRFDAAAAYAAKLCERYPNRRALVLARVFYLLCDFREELAQPLLADLLASAPAEGGATEAQLFRYFVCFGRTDDALKLLEAWSAPNDVEKSALKIKLLSLGGRHEEAFRLATEALDKSTDELRWRVYVEAGVAAKQIVELERRLREALKNDKSNVDLTAHLIDALIAAERAGEALDVARSFPASGMEAAIARRLWMASCHLGARNYDLAVKEIEALMSERLVRSNRGVMVDLRRRLVEALGLAGRHDEALARLDRWYAPDADLDASERMVGRTLRVMALQNADRTEDYLGELEALHRDNPDYAGYLNDLGYTWVDLGRNLERATRMIRAAVADQPLNSAYLDSLGWAYYKAGDFAAAQKWLARSVRLPIQVRDLGFEDGRDAVLHDHLGDALYRLGDSAGAVENWKKSIELANAATEETRRRHWAPVAAAAGAKIAAVERGGTPATAPTAAEQAKK